MLTELARQVGLALHNVQLDSALQASLDELKRRQRASCRPRAPASSPRPTPARRKIERNLHDGAQQHLVALAVNLRLARQLADADPEQASEMLDELGGDLQDAIQELRELAHGIYPPLLMDRGLTEALRAAADRCAARRRRSRPTASAATRAEIEAAVYFCCLEALQNAGKHAGEGATSRSHVARGRGHARVRGGRRRRRLRTATGAPRAHGFVNMSDRLGAIGGALRVDSAPGKGTHDLRPRSRFDAFGVGTALTPGRRTPLTPSGQFARPLSSASSRRTVGPKPPC